MESPEPATDEPPHVALFDLFRAFSVIGLTSFGGGVSGWIFRELVENRQWISPREFVEGLALARTMPGANVVNLSIWIGYRLRGTPGAVIATTSVLAGPVVIVIVLAVLYHSWGRSMFAHWALLGVAAASLGMGASMGVKTLPLLAKAPFYAAIALAAFIAIGVLRWPMLPVVAVLGPLSVAWAFLFDTADET